MIRHVLLAAAALVTASPALAQTTLNAGFNGTATTNMQYPVPGAQTFTLNGVFTSFAASANLPQINGGDLSSYHFTITGTSSNYDDPTRTTTYSNLTGLIYYDLNGDGAYEQGSDPLVQGLTAPTLTATFNAGFTAADLVGSLYSTGAVQFAGNTLDLTPINGAAVTGQYISTGVQNGIVRGSIVFPNALGAVPEPASWAMMIGGFGVVGGALRRRRKAVARVSYAA